MQLILITNDLFDISARLKSINPNYVLYYNPFNTRYEVHNVCQRGNTLAFIVPYDELDARTLDYACKTHVSNVDEIVKEVEQNNKKLDKQRISYLAEMGAEMLT